jgi:hypothetical protein
MHFIYSNFFYFVKHLLWQGNEALLLQVPTQTSLWSLYKKCVLLGPLDFKVKLIKSQCNEFILHSLVMCLTSLFTILGT